MTASTSKCKFCTNIVVAEKVVSDMDSTCTEMSTPVSLGTGTANSSFFMSCEAVKSPRTDSTAENVSGLLICTCGDAAIAPATTATVVATTASSTTSSSTTSSIMRTAAVGAKPPLQPAPTVRFAEPLTVIAPPAMEFSVTDVRAAVISAALFDEAFRQPLRPLSECTARFGSLPSAATCHRRLLLNLFYFLRMYATLVAVVLAVACLHRPLLMVPAAIALALRVAKRWTATAQNSGKEQAQTLATETTTTARSLQSSSNSSVVTATSVLKTAQTLACVLLAFHLGWGAVCRGLVLVTFPIMIHALLTPPPAASELVVYTILAPRGVPVAAPVSPTESFCTVALDSSLACPFPEE